jgi:hypothetical protein
MYFKHEQERDLTLKNLRTILGFESLNSIATWHIKAAGSMNVKLSVFYIEDLYNFLCNESAELNFYARI